MYVIKFTGFFGFMKDYMSLNASEITSQKFLSRGTLAGMERKFFPELHSEPYREIITRHRLSYAGMSRQQEVIQPSNFNSLAGVKDTYVRGNKAGKKGILIRNVLVYPCLHLAFENKEYAERAFKQDICLSRNEDIMIPRELFECTEEEFDKIDGFEFISSEGKDSIGIGYNKYNQKWERGEIKIFGNPIQKKICN